MSSEAHAISHQLMAEIKASILSGDLAPGTRLTEAALAKKMGVNRAPLREALLRLEERQLIERVPYSGMRVAQPDLRKVLELYEISEALEALAAQRAAIRITDAEVANLHRLLDESDERVRRLGNQDARKLPAIREFHIEIARIGGNAELASLLGREIWQFLRAAHRTWGRSSERLLQGAREHRRILEALEARDPELAGLMMRRHSANVRKTLEQHVVAEA